jgi:hypothetical protein
MIDRHYSHRAREDVSTRSASSTQSAPLSASVAVGARWVDTANAGHRPRCARNDCLSRRIVEALFRTRTGDPSLLSSEEAHRVKIMNANWTAGRDGEEGGFELMIVTSDDRRHVVAPSPAAMTALVALAEADRFSFGIRPDER